MTQPVSYFQTNPAWKDVRYSAKGESTTIGRSGCGPTAMAMVLATWADRRVTPKTECAWALAHGYKAPHQGTYYGYFKPAAARFGLTAYMLNGASIYGKADSPYHAKAKDALDQGHLVIACMGKGLWTSSGHFVLVWKIQGNTVFINDPASSRAERTRGNYDTFKREVKYYFVIEHPKKKVDDSKKETTTKKEEPMDISKLTPAECYAIWQKAMEHANTLPEPEWSRQEGAWGKAQGKGIVDGNGPERPVKRDELTAILSRMKLL